MLLSISLILSRLPFFPYKFNGGGGSCEREDGAAKET